MNTVHNKSKRIIEIDQLKGVTILLVIIFHIGANTGIPLLSTVRMPLFFFLSGFVFKKTPLPISEFFSFVKGKFCRLILPCITMGSLYTYIVLGENFFSFINDGSKKGYWFLWVLFIFCIFMFFYNYLSSRFSRGKIYRDIILIIAMATSFMAVITAIHVIGSDSVERFITNTSCLRVATIHIVPFLFGVIVGKYESITNLLFKDQRSFTFSLILFMLLGYYRISNPGDLYSDSYFVLAVNYAINLLIGVFAINCIGYMFFSALPKKGFIMDKLAYIGTRTLDIYVIHYFVLSFTQIHKFTNSTYPIFEFIINMLLVIIIAGISLSIGFIIRQSRLLGFLMLGVKYSSFGRDNGKKIVSKPL